MKRLIPILIFTLLLGACMRSTVFKEYKTFENISWNRFDFLIFEVPVLQGQQLDFDLALRHHTYFPYDYLDVNITFYLPDGGMRTKDYHFELKDDNGAWKSKGMGELWDIQLPIHRGMLFSEAGTCQVRIENKMTKVELPGIMEVGLLVYEAEGD